MPKRDGCASRQHLPPDETLQEELWGFSFSCLLQSSHHALPSMHLTWYPRAQSLSLTFSIAIRQLLIQLIVLCANFVAGSATHLQAASSQTVATCRLMQEWLWAGGSHFLYCFTSCSHWEGTLAISGNFQNSLTYALFSEMQNAKAILGFVACPRCFSFPLY